MILSWVRSRSYQMSQPLSKRPRIVIDRYLLQPRLDARLQAHRGLADAEFLRQQLGDGAVCVTAFGDRPHANLYNAAAVRQRLDAVDPVLTAPWRDTQRDA